MTIEEEYRLKVEEGARMLDDRHPGWRQLINGSRLHMSSCVECVVGQLYGSFGRGTRTLAEELGMPAGASDETVIGFAKRHGLTVSSGDIDEFTVLDRLWREEIEKGCQVGSTSVWYRIS